MSHARRPVFEDEMQVEIKKIDKLKRVMNVTVEGEEFLKGHNEQYQEIGRTLKVKGFRPGSVPLDILERHYGNALAKEYLKKMLPLYYRNALVSQNLIPAALPRIYDVKLTKECLKFSAEFEVKPQLDLEDGKYKSIPIEHKKVEVGEDEIDKVLGNLKEKIKTIISRDLDEAECARWAGYADSAELREAIKTEIFLEKLKNRKRKIDDTVIKHLLKYIKVEAPHSAVERYHKELVDNEIYKLKLRSTPEQDIEKYKKDIEEQLKPLAEEQVKLLYILEAIAQKENIKIDNDSALLDVLGFILSKAEYK